MIPTLGSLETDSLWGPAHAPRAKELFSKKAWEWPCEFTTVNRPSYEWSNSRASCCGLELESLVSCLTQIPLRLTLHRSVGIAQGRPSCTFLREDSFRHSRWPYEGFVTIPREKWQVLGIQNASRVPGTKVGMDVEMLPPKALRPRWPTTTHSRKGTPGHLTDPRVAEASQKALKVPYQSLMELHCIAPCQPPATKLTLAEDTCHIQDRSRCCTVSHKGPSSGRRGERTIVTKPQTRNRHFQNLRVC